MQVSWRHGLFADMHTKMKKKNNHKEKLKSQEPYLYKVDSLLQKQFTLEELGELLPGNFHVNSIDDFGLLFFDKSVEEVLKCSPEKVRSERPSFQQKFIHPDDVVNVPPQLRHFVNQNDHHSIISFFQRLKGIGDAHYEWYFTTCKISEYGLLCISHATKNIGDYKNQIENILDENVFFKKNFEKFLLLTKREKEILKDLAVGKTAPQISEEYFISVNTVKTHRQRIFEKLEVKTFTELYKYAFHFDLL